MNHAKAENNIISFSSFAQRAAHTAGAGTLLSKARVASAQGEKEAFLAELSGYVDEVLGNRVLMIQREVREELPQVQHRSAPHLRLLKGGK